MQLFGRFELAILVAQFSNPLLKLCNFPFWVITLGNPLRIREDLDKIQNVTWQQLSLARLADAMLKTESDQRKRKKVAGQP
ncbi:hypothetical protein [Burkholderia lata]|uniref:Uncharacterized protein n=1 Tax=Burkholderia lata (strain ATCC 17760 / DSM 23089 / LMG 22485 / NCIMB 9086 / R18194 / 383) TaxID=482957 RepID=Q391M9_BURL3|nr:hypothetical protein [Burkholderia lata]ABB12837.1 hypothetical protein Bcep18194_B2726 [Burkholderia lata]